MHRREFMFVPALAGMAPASTAASSTGAVRASLAGCITAAALTIDSVGVALCSSAVGSRVKAILAGDLDVLGIGGMVQLSPNDVPGLLHGLNNRAKAREAALALGFLIDRARSGFSPQPGADEECDIYRDAAIMREYSDLPEVDLAADPSQVYDLFASLENRRLIGIHTFAGDKGDMNGWIERLVEWRRESHALLRRYAEVYAKPDPALMRKYITGPRFYDRHDGPIRLAYAVRNGAVMSRADLKKLSTGASARSQYAQALLKAHGCLAAASRFLEGTIGRDELIRLLGE